MLTGFSFIYSESDSSRFIIQRDHTTMWMMDLSWGKEIRCQFEQPQLETNNGSCWGSRNGSKNQEEGMDSSSAELEVYILSSFRGTG